MNSTTNRSIPLLVEGLVVLVVEYYSCGIQRMKPMIAFLQVSELYIDEKDEKETQYCQCTQYITTATNPIISSNHNPIESLAKTKAEPSCFAIYFVVASVGSPLRCC